MDKHSAWIALGPLGGIALLIVLACLYYRYAGRTTRGTHTNFDKATSVRLLEKKVTKSWQREDLERAQAAAARASLDMAQEPPTLESIDNTEWFDISEEPTKRRFVLEEVMSDNFHIERLAPATPEHLPDSGVIEGRIPLQIRPPSEKSGDMRTMTSPSQCAVCSVAAS